MKIIDAHLHFSNSEGLKETAEIIGEVDYSGNGLVREFEKSNVVAGIVMSVPDAATYLLSDFSLNLKGKNKDLYPLVNCVGIDPTKLLQDSGEIYRIEQELNQRNVVGIKIYAGYFHYYVYDPIYDPIYALARKYNVPVAIHCGDTQSAKGLLKYSHPLTIDELAVNHEDITFVICHIGVPWVMDTAELILKNHNVYTDVSGLIGGNKEHVKEMESTRLFIEYIQQALLYANRYDKVLFGSDWPLVPIGPYIDFIKHIVPAKYHEDVFYHNALAVFSRLKHILVQ